MANVNERVAAWINSKRAELIDTSRRNRLLYFKPSETGTVRLTEPSLNEIFKWLVVDEKTFQFYPLDPQHSLLDFDEEEENPTLPARIKPRRLDEVRSDLPEQRLRKNLYSLRQKARTSLQEKGIVTLYVAFGFLEWTESKDSSLIIRSPLLLVPVELVRETAQSPYKLRLFEENVELNPTLVYKLRTDYGIELPGLPDLDKLNLSDYFQQVISSVQPNGNWPVIQEAYLGVFSFPKISIYNDPAWNKAGQHPLIRALAGDSSGLDLPPSDLPEGAELDRLVKPQETFQVRDADSSQQEAIQAAKRGVSFVLQGPPGTGKSQTITNIIAECLADGKKVLFVSEKMAALEVVSRRLTEDGVGEFCLEAHSHKANKREVVFELGRTLNAPRSSGSDVAADFAEFALLRERLNDYVVALHRPHPPSGYSAFQVHGWLAQRETAPDLLFDFAGASKTTLEALARIDSLLTRLTQSHEILANYDTHPWFGVTATQYSLQLKSDIGVHFNELITLLAELELSAQKLATVCGVVEPIGLKQTDRLFALARLVGQSPLPLAEWFCSGGLSPLIEKAQVYQASFEDYRNRRSNLLVWWAESIFTLAHEELKARLTTCNQAIRESLLPNGKAAEDRLIRERELLTTTLTQSSEQMERLLENSLALARACSVYAPTSLTGVTELNSLAEIMLHDPKPQQDWFARSRLFTLKADAEEARNQYTTYRTTQEQIAARYEDEIFRLDHTALIERFTVSYGSFLRLFRTDYYRDLRLVRSALKIQGKLGYVEALRDLKTARQIVERKCWIDERKEAHLHKFGPHYNGLDTKWDAVLSAVDCCRQIVDRLGDGRVPDSLIRILVESGPAIENIHRQRDSVQATQNRLDKELSTLQRMCSLDRLPFTDRSLHDAHLGELKNWLDALTAEARDFCTAYDEVVTYRKPGNAIAQITVAQLLANLGEAQDLIRIETAISTNATQLQAEFGHLFSGMETRWENVLAALDWTGNVLNWFGAESPPEDFVAVVSGQKPGVEEARRLSTGARSIRESVAKESGFLFDLFPHDRISVDHQSFEAAALTQIISWVRFRLDNLPDLEEWIQFQQTQTECEAAGLGSFASAILRAKPPLEALKPAFYKRFWTLWLDALHQSDKTLAGFSGKGHEAAIAQFRELDKKQMQLAQKRLRQRLFRARPSVGWSNAPTGETSILQRELNKQRRHKPLRQLFGEIPNLLLALKPCLLLSPLSVAQFLDTNLIQFDLVIFDEASQICSEDVVGAIVRGKQLIVVGDNKQLPPSRFFAAGIVEDFDSEEEEEEVSSDLYESILDECESIGLPSKMLRWHYRSKCEALIAFSNRHLYDNRLVTFPGPFSPQENVADRCVEFVYVPSGIYLRGKVSGKGTNRLEARKVAELIFDHFSTNPQQSLGVIAFSETQMTAIDDAVRHLRTAKPEFERFFAENEPEPFFIKNLENVQGDERDVIFFSVGYGHDEAGKMLMNFGPLNRAGGERRLNVAVTRAKHKVKLVSSILPQDIDLARTQAKGAALLKNYLEYAQRGPSALAGINEFNPDVECDSPFEEEVCQALQARGLTVHSQVGCSGYRIDLAVVDDAHPGRYLLGIECDGKTYHSSKTARDRDRLRQTVLEDLGWRILRIWSSDWVRNREAQVMRVIEALAAAKTTPIEIADQTPLSAAAQEPQESLPVDRAESILQPNKSLLTVLETSDIDNIPQALKGVVEYIACNIGHRGYAEDFYLMAEYNSEILVDVLADVVKHEGPIHILVATRRVIAGWGMGKAGSNLVIYVKAAAHRAARRSMIEIKGDFLWPHGLERVAVRVPASGDKPRDIEEIAIEEIAEAAYLCVKEAFGINCNDLATQTARLLGYNRTGSQVRERIEQAIEFCLKEKRIKRNGESVSLA
jgi:very-short-patch-repair endonuclease